jgi:methylated-DNA-[protein]-cysteine S-methyltransferase
MSPHDTLINTLRQGRTDAALAGLRAGLADRAGTDDLLDVAYRMVDSPVGRLLLATTPAGLARVAYATGGSDRILADLAGRISPRVLLAPGRLDDAARQLDEYFAGRRQRFTLSLDFQLSAGFRRLVLAQLMKVPYGTTASYGAVATATGRPKAVRAVGTACATNPLPVVVPCHRIVRSDGTVGAYVGGVEAKEALLSLEAAL